VTVKLKYANFQQITRSQSCLAPIGSQAELEDIALGLLRPHFPPQLGVRLLGVTISNLTTAEPESRTQLALMLKPTVPDGSYQP
jgi:DNA polymerase-4